MAFANMDLLNDYEAGYNFDQTFGKMGIVEGQTYYDPMNALDKTLNVRKEMGTTLAKNLGLNKAPSINTTTGGTFTEYPLIPSFIDSEIVDRTVRETPLLGLISRKAVRGRAYVYNLISAKAGPTSGTPGYGFLLDDAPLSEDVDTRSNATVNMKYLYTVGRVTGPAMRSAEGSFNLMEEDIRTKTSSLMESLENEIINGAVATAPAGFDGLRALITTNTTDNSAAAITLDQFRADLNTSFEANGRIDLAVTDGTTHNVLKGLLFDIQRQPAMPSSNPAIMSFGIPDAFMIDGVTVIRDRFMPVTATAHEVLYLDSRYLFLGVLQDITFSTLAKTNDSDKYYLKWYGSLVVTFEASMVRRYGIA